MTWFVRLPDFSWTSRGSKSGRTCGGQLVIRIETRQGFKRLTTRCFQPTAPRFHSEIDHKTITYFSSITNFFASSNRYFFKSLNEFATTTVIANFLDVRDFLGNCRSRCWCQLVIRVVNRPGRVIRVVKRPGLKRLATRLFQLTASRIH